MAALRNIRHEKFAQALAAGRPQTTAYVEAGYSPGGAAAAASKVANRPDVKQRVADFLQTLANQEQKANQKAVDALAITREDVLRELWDNAMRGKAAVPVLDHEGKETGEFRTDLSASNKAFELFGKEAHRMFVDRKEILTGPIDSLTHEERKSLLALLDELTGQPGTAPAIASPAATGTPRVTH